MLGRSGKKYFHPQFSYSPTCIHTRYTSQPNLTFIRSKLDFSEFFLCDMLTLVKTHDPYLSAPIWVNHSDFSLTNKSAKINSNGTCISILAIYYPIFMLFSLFCRSMHTKSIPIETYFSPHIFTNPLLLCWKTHVSHSITEPNSSKMILFSIWQRDRMRIHMNNEVKHRWYVKSENSWNHFSPWQSQLSAQKYSMKTWGDVQYLTGIGFYVKFAILHMNVSTFDILLIATHDRLLVKTHKLSEKCRSALEIRRPPIISIRDHVLPYVLYNICSPHVDRMIFRFFRIFLVRHTSAHLILAYSIWVNYSV